MWRRYGDVLYAVLLSAVLTAETLALGAVTWAFLLGLTGIFEGIQLEYLVLGAVVVTALTFVVVATFVVAYHAFSERRQRMVLAAVDRWTDRWVGVILERRPRPRTPLPAAAVEALLNLREVLQGTEGQQVAEMIRGYRLGEQLARRAGKSAAESLLARVRVRTRRLRSTRRMARRLDALEAMAKARLPETFPSLVALLDDPHSPVRLMALRGVARTIARMPTEADRQRAAGILSDKLRHTRLPSGAIEECLLLLEEASPAVVANLLREPQAAGPIPGAGWTIDGSGFHSDRSAAPRGESLPSLLRAALDAAGRLKLLSLGGRVTAHVGHPDPEVRAAAIRALGRLGYLPEGAEAGLANALRDDVEFVRTQAAHVAPLLPPDDAVPRLWELLGDPSWWVRRAAGESLSRIGGRGPQELERAAQDHPDRYARHMAAQMLLQAGRMGTEEAREIQEAR